MPDAAKKKAGAEHLLQGINFRPESAVLIGGGPCQQRCHKRRAMRLLRMRRRTRLATGHRHQSEAAI
jgi:hypothetical protein